MSTRKTPWLVISLMSLVVSSALIAKEKQNDPALKKPHDQVQEPPQKQRYDMLLMGGGVAMCSSMQPQHCVGDVKMSNAKTATLVSLDPIAIEQLARSSFWLPSRHAVQQQVMQVLAVLQSKWAQQPMTDRTFLQHFRQLQLPATATTMAIDGAALLAQLQDAEIDLILDSLEIYQASAADSRVRLTEQAFPDSTKDQFSLELYREFVEQAALRRPTSRPKVLVMTASGRDPFAAVDFYLDLFQKLGADATWFPLNAASQAAARQQQDCSSLELEMQQRQGSFQRGRVYPDLMAQQLAFCQQGETAALALLQQADGIFINGGNQSLTYQALKAPDGSDTAMLALIRSKIAAGELIMAGTSAGTAVQGGGQYQGQATVMISNGESHHALEHGAVAAAAPQPGCQHSKTCGEGLTQSSLTYQAAGGFGLFPWGILDTHFSERGREGRLLTLVAQTQAYYGFGVDEATALLVRADRQQPDKAHFRVLGAEGVYVVERHAQSQYQRGKKLQLMSHYFTREDEFSVAPTGIVPHIAPWKTPTILESNNTASGVSSDPAVVMNYPALAGDAYRQHAQEFCIKPATMLAREWQLPNSRWQWQLQRAAKTSSQTGVYQQNNQHKVYCSYQNMGVLLHLLSV